MKWLRLPSLIAASVLLCTPGVPRAQVSTSAVPIYHGRLTVHPARGWMHRHNGNAVLWIRGWKLEPDDLTDGIFPDQEPVLVAMGEETFRLDAGQLVMSHGGKRFSYRAPHHARRGIRSIRLVRRADGAYRVRIVLGHVDLSRLKLERPVCIPMAVIIGDDDGFSCVLITRRSFRSHSVSIHSTCDSCTDWPWVN